MLHQYFDGLAETQVADEIPHVQFLR